MDIDTKLGAEASGRGVITPSALRQIDRLEHRMGPKMPVLRKLRHSEKQVVVERKAGDIVSAANGYPSTGCPDLWPARAPARPASSCAR